LLEKRLRDWKQILRFYAFQRTGGTFSGMTVAQGLMSIQKNVTEDTGPCERSPGTTMYPTSMNILVNINDFYYKYTRTIFASIVNIDEI